MFSITPSAIVSNGFETVEPYVRDNFEYVMIDGKEEPVHELMGLEYFGTRNVKHISKITRDNRIENLVGPNGETHTRKSEVINRRPKKKSKKKSIRRVVVITMPDGEELEYDSLGEASIALGYINANVVGKIIRRGTPHADGWSARYEERER